jgi:hypothetical protein
VPCSSPHCPFLCTQDLFRNGYLLYGSLTVFFMLWHLPLTAVLLLLSLRQQIVGGGGSTPADAKETDTSAAAAEETGVAATAKAGLASALHGLQRLPNAVRLVALYTVLGGAAMYAVPLVDVLMVMLPLLVSRQEGNFLQKVGKRGGPQLLSSQLFFSRWC